MSVALFDKIHTSSDYNRTHPATLSEFMEFGLRPSDYLEYVGLQQMFQGAILLDRLTPKNIKTQETLSALIDFCLQKKLIDSQYVFDDTKLIDYAAYYIDWTNDWQKYPKDESVFRLDIERKFSLMWDDETAYLYERLGYIDFWYDSYDEEKSPEYNDQIRVRKYVREINEYVILKQNEVAKLCRIVKSDLDSVEKSIKSCQAELLAENILDAAKDENILVKIINDLDERQWIIESVLENLQAALKTPDVLEVKETDLLYIFCETDKCKENGHLVSDVRVEFNFYTKPKKRHTIKRCAHCKRFYMTLEDLLDLIDNYECPRANIVYDDEVGTGGGSFGSESVFYKLGYTVNENSTLSTEKRQAILKYTIDSGEATKRETLNFLKRRMNRNGKKKGNEAAFYKWKEDYEYILKL